MKTRCKQNRVRWLALFLIFLAGLWLNLPAKISTDGVRNFDWWSNDIMISDLMFRQNYGEEGVFLNQVTPRTISPGNDNGAEGVQPAMFAAGETFEKEMFEQYTSNVVVQRFLYAWLDGILPVSNGALILLLQFVNCLLMAAVLAGLLQWLAEETSPAAAIGTAAILVLLCPYFAMYGKNLYWCGWTLFLPMLVFCRLPQKMRLNESALPLPKLLALFGAAFGTCLVKQLYYFEFVSTVMVAMVVPLIYYLVAENVPLKRSFAALCAAGTGAVVSFAVVYWVRLQMLIAQYGPEEGRALSSANLGSRLMGIDYADVELWSPVKAVVKMSMKTFVSVKGVVVDTMAYGLILLILEWLLCWALRRRIEIQRKLWAMLAATTVSVAAPCSWFVLAAPHTTIHNIHCSIVWFCPFGILILALTGRVIGLLWQNRKELI